MSRRFATIGLLALGYLSAPSTPAQAQPPIGRWSAEEIDCPEGTELQHAEAPDASYSALWCEASRGTKVARHGPYLELYADGSTARQGLYHRGLQAGSWIAWTPAGEIASERVILPGEAGRHILQPEDLCPPGSVRERSLAFSDRHHMDSVCHEINEDGEEVMVGPYVTWDEERSPNGTRYLLRSIMHYKNDQRHGLHRVFEGPFDREVLVEEETFAEGSLHGPSRAYFLDGSLREVRHYNRGRLDGERIAYYHGGKERWRIVYEADRKVVAEGDFTVAGEPCPGRAVPTLSADGRQEYCAYRRIHFLQRQGPYLERDASGEVVESGRYEQNEKVELWQAPPGVELPPEVSDDIQVAEIQLLVGDRLYRELNDPPPEEPIDPAQLMAPDLETLELQLANLGIEPSEAQPLDGPELLSPNPADSSEPEPSPIEFDIWFRNNVDHKYPHPRTEVEDGVVRVYGLPPGSYYMKVEVDAESSNDEQRPGDLTSSSEFEVTLGEVTQSTAQLLYTLHLTEPWDNNGDIPGKTRCGEEAVLPGAPRFAWQAPVGEDPKGIEYVYTLRRLRCDPRAELELMAKSSTYDTFLEIDLPPSRRNEVYEWSLVAKRGDKAIGQLMTFRENSYGWALRFRVE